jgi:hydroxymethylglutaryl-CoA reductase
MSLHARQVALSAGAEGDEIATIAAQLIARDSIKATTAVELLDALRAGALVH